MAPRANGLLVEAFRLVNSISIGAPSLRCKLSLLREQGFDTRDIDARLAGKTRQEIAELTAGGDLAWCSPMVPVFEDLRIAYSSTFRLGGDSGLRALMFHACPFVVRLRIPRDLILIPFTHVVETEMLVDADSVSPFVVDATPNPFRQVDLEVTNGG